MIAFGYPIFLIVVCTVYAVLTRKIPEAFNESKHIGFTMYTTCVIWLAFVPLYFGTGNHVPLRITSMSVTISMSASVTLTCLFSPKLYIILVHPERNVRQSMMPMRYSAIKSPAVTGTTQTGSMMAAAVVCNQTRSYTIQQIHASSQGVDSGTQSDGTELDRQRKSEFSLVHQETQTEDCGEAQDLPQSSNSHSVDVQSKTCHIINSSSNGPMSIPASHKSRDVQL
uniref:G-protein coupled receptors family 3 profile domain-containing protein n=1 Tax=Timema cristinae TaxID=61476 RepID=A0A7R9DRF4_TIMCR|nr:unnamed protein product [Timema cristinae]